MEIIFPKIEKEILDFWKKNNVFKKTLEKSKNKPRFVFYEGPPFANGLPGIHHLLARAFKDVILRYKTMKGFFAERKAGWDTHGLPTEMSAEKTLGIKSKREIESDVENFVAACRSNVFGFKKEWEEFTERIGYWLDLEKPYITCSNEYVESLWWILKKIWDKGFLYQDYKVVPYCPRCGTSLSSHELAQGYKITKDNSIFVKFPVKNEKNTYLLVWTTTPWTLPGNVAVAVNPDIKYVKAEVEGEILILAEQRLSALGKEYKVTEELKGKNLKGLEYEPPFGFSKPDKRAWFVVLADYVSLEDGTGLVHIAPAFGEEDMQVGKENDLPVILNITDEGRFKDEVSDFAGKFVKDADPLIIEDLKNRNLIFKEEIYEHEYPFCWRCGTPLLYYAKDSWFIRVSEIKKDLIDRNKKINWVPGYLKEGRFGEWLKDVKDWNLSRERYWGTPLPIWQCEKCEKRKCIGSIEELRENADKDYKIEDLHRPAIDEITFDCECGGKMKRVKEVIDCWFDSGAMPFAQLHYPFENKDLIDKKKYFPADFICEGIDQTRGWFYTLLVISTLLGLESPYKNVISVGIVLDENGQKMSKSKGNIVKPADITEKYGADVARFYFYTINPVAEPKSFSFNDVQVLYRKFFDTILNIQKFFDTYAEKKQRKEEFNSDNILDKWIVSLLEKLNEEVERKLEEYDIVGAARLFEGFVDDLSNWYVRRSRKRFQKDAEAAQTLYCVLLKLARLLAPFTPFLAESLYRGLGGKEESVHMDKYPSADKGLINENLQEKMLRVREIVNLGLKERARAGIKVRQPLNELAVGNLADNLDRELLDLAREELNLKGIRYDVSLKDGIKLDENVSAELKEEGIVREIIRSIQILRKEAELRPEDEIIVNFSGGKELDDILDRNKENVLSEGRIKDLSIGQEGSENKIKIEGKEVSIEIKKI
ncbi:MAG: isoleucine--tRNA ligase [Candidatus Paceibacterota bacterium]|jgi:isoleucyl-tRNA synthetase